jgi:hypothetical protein
MAADQRYCLECGERRGAPRLPLMDGLAPRTREPAPAPRRRRPRMSPNSTLIAGVGTLLLALGIGVLIGRSGDHSGSAGNNPAVQVVKVPGAGTGTAGAAPTTAAKKAAGAKAAKAKISAKSGGGVVGSDVSAAEGQPKEALPPPTVKLGQSGHGAGYNKNGKFDGSFFGP